MKRFNAMFKSTTNDFQGAFYVILTVLILASSNSIIKKLLDIGSVHAGNNNPITFCNVLFVGNLCALITLLIIYHRQWDLSLFQNLSGADWGKMLTVSALSTGIAPAVIFIALANTSATNVILIGRLEPPLLMLLSVVLLHEQATKWQVAGLTLAFAGVITTIIIPQLAMQARDSNIGISLGEGEIFAAVGAIAYACSTIISKKITNIPLGIFAIFRMFFGTILFFLLAIIIFGPQHFGEAFSPFLWQWMILYGGIIIVSGQLCWYKGLRMAKTSQISLITSFFPVAGITAAFLILAEVPTVAQWIGGGIILAGIFIGQLGRQPVSNDKADGENKKKQAMDSGGTGGFKGV